MTTSRAQDLPSRSLSLEQNTYLGYRILQCLFVVAPILAGLDKFFHVLTNWNQYLAPQVASLVNGRVSEFMMVVGIIEIVAGVGVALKPKYFAFVVMAWLLGIIINLLSFHAYLDIALRDLGLAAAAFVLGRLALHYDTGNLGGLIRHHPR